VHKGSEGLPDPLLGDLGGLLLRLAELRTFHIFSVVNQQQATGRELSYEAEEIEGPNAFA
jgi:hypothetical protein